MFEFRSESTAPLVALYSIYFDKIIFPFLRTVTRRFQALSVLGALPPGAAVDHCSPHSTDPVMGQHQLTSAQAMLQISLLTAGYPTILRRFHTRLIS